MIILVSSKRVSVHNNLLHIVSRSYPAQAAWSLKNKVMMMIGSYGSHQCCHRPLNNCISLSFCFCSIRRFQIPKVGPRKFNVVRYNQTAPRHFRPQDKAKVVSRPRLSCGWKCLGANQTYVLETKNFRAFRVAKSSIVFT